MNITMHHNREYSGLELTFDKRPDQSVIDSLKEQGFRWHNKKKLWFAKETEARIAFARRLGAIDPSEKTVEPEKTQESSTSKAPAKAEKEEKIPNTFAAHYDAIGDARILTDSDISLLDQREAYFSDINVHFHRQYRGECITVTELENAGKSGKACQSWRIYGLSYGEDVTGKLMNDEGITSCKALYQALKDGAELEHVRIRASEEKAVDVFSPFIEVKPLKDLPEKWTKRNFAQALMSGQLFRCEVSYHYTDDYAKDAAYNFSEGVGLNMPSFVREALEDWGSLTHVYTSDRTPCRDGSYVVNYSEHSNSGKTLWFDVNCDIGEGKRRAEERKVGLERYNKMMKDSCIMVKAQQFDPKKLYTVQQLELNGNTGRYETKQENMPGHRLIGRIEEGFLWDVLSVKELEIQPDLIYEVSNFNIYDRPNAELLKDERVIDCGNWKSIVTGKALQELIAEQKHMPRISLCRDEYGPDFKSAEKMLQQFASGHSAFFGCNATNYSASLDRLRSEYARATGKGPTLDSLIGSAQSRNAARQPAESKGHVVPFQR